MTVGMIGRKCGMTSVFDEHGKATAVTVIEASPNRVTQLKAINSDGYTAVQVTAGQQKRHRLNKAQIGHLARAGVESGKGLWEFRTTPEAVAALELGGEITLTQFNVGDYVDVVGETKGKGFAGGVKRHNFSMQDATHGNSVSHRAIGSTGQCQEPGRVFKGKKMPGQMGHVRRTVQNLKVVALDTEHNLILVQGAVPGPVGNLVRLTASVKRRTAVVGESA